jgi:hypothetical protein
MNSEKAVAAFYEEHRGRLQKISDRQWREEYASANPYSKMIMLCRRDYERYVVEFFKDGTGKLATILGSRDCIQTT